MRTSSHALPSVKKVRIHIRRVVSVPALTGETLAAGVILGSVAHMSETRVDNGNPSGVLIEQGEEVVI